MKTKQRFNENLCLGRYHGNNHNTQETTFRFTTPLEKKQGTQIYIDVGYSDQIGILAFRVIQSKLTLTYQYYLTNIKKAIKHKKVWRSTKI